MNDEADSARLDATVRGHVQGVGFRMWVLRTATRLALTGWVRNEADGAVRTVAEGPRSALEDLLGRLRNGPSNAWVSGVDERWEPPTGSFEGFSIRPGGHSGD